MEFRDFYYSLAAPEREDFAEAVDSTVGYLNLLASGHKRAGESLALRIEEKSERRVPVETMRPDVPWHVIRGKPEQAA